MSCNSDSKLKRSFKSISSNPSHSGNNSADDKSKKKKAAQKSLGTAWGAKSSSSRPAFSSSPFSDFGSYMAVKNQKLQEQFDAAASSSFQSDLSSEKSIFWGISIFVDGYTIPTNQELRGYMLKHGGRFENYFSRHRVTHIICSNLPDSKIKNLRAFSGGLPVVKPAWVLDSVVANKLLNWIPYQLDQLTTDNRNQPKLSAFFTLKNSRVSDIADRHSNDGEISELEMPSLTTEDYGLYKENTPSEVLGGWDIESEDFQMNNDKVMAVEPAYSVESVCEVSRVEMSDVLPLPERNPGSEPTTSAVKTSAQLCKSRSVTYNCEGSSSKTIPPPNQQHSTFSDPKFVENYFKSSRLHFIGTWRNRYRKRHPSSLTSSGNKSSSLKTTPEIQNVSIIHIDMDSFFVSVVIRNHPELQDKPVAVCHSDNRRGTAEISSANYPARNHGVKAGMFVKDAKVRCPQLVIVKYDFEAYEKVADQFYDILHKYCSRVQAVSCDEAFLDVSESEIDDPQLLASVIRKEILDTTGCTASAGIAGNMLMARLATKTAKPDGQCCIPLEQIDSYLCELPVKALPGIGHVLDDKLKKRQIETCGQLRLMTKESLKKHFGMKTGEMLWNYSRGIDNRLVGVIQESKSIGADVNWGVRFQNIDDARQFLGNLCKEVALRLQGCGAQGRSFTLKIKKRKSDAGEPVKYMGCGECENLSHTITVPMATDDVDVLQRLANQLFGHFNIDVKDIRGVGLQVTKLEGADDDKPVHKRNSIHSWLVSTPTKKTEQEETAGVSNRNDADNLRSSGGAAEGPSGSGTTGRSVQTGSDMHSTGSATLPSLHDIDVSVIESLPPEVISEINDMYGGKLLGFISDIKRKPPNANIISPMPVPSGEVVEEMEPIESASASLENHMPTSMSQIDPSVLEELPNELRQDILENLPMHRKQEMVKGASSNVIENQDDDIESNNDLWIGSPPKWVGKFEISKCFFLNNFAKVYRSGTAGCLSNVLQHMIYEMNLYVDISFEELDDTVNSVSELFKQYVKLKVATDIEEIHYCLCLLRKLTKKSKCFLQVYDAILPHLQAIVGDKYGGTLDISSSNT